MICVAWSLVSTVWGSSGGNTKSDLINHRLSGLEWIAVWRAIYLICGQNYLWFPYSVLTFSNKKCNFCFMYLTIYLYILHNNTNLLVTICLYFSLISYSIFLLTEIIWCKGICKWFFSELMFACGITEYSPFRWSQTADPSKIFRCCWSFQAIITFYYTIPIDE